MEQIYRCSRRFLLPCLLVLGVSSCATRTAHDDTRQIDRPAAFQEHKLSLTHDALKALKESLVKNGVARDNGLTLKIDPDGASCKASCGGGTSQSCNTTQCGAVDGSGCWEEGPGGQPKFKLCVTVEPPPQSRYDAEPRT